MSTARKGNGASLILGPTTTATLAALLGLPINATAIGSGNVSNAAASTVAELQAIATSATGNNEIGIDSANHFGISGLIYGTNGKAEALASSTAGFLLGLVCAQPGYDTPFECVSFQVYVQLGFAVVGMLMVLLFLHDEPPTPSSFATSRDVSLIALLPSLGSLLRSANFMLLVIVAGCSQGVFATWSSLLDLLLKQYGPSTSAWLGFGANASGIVGGLVMGAVSSKVTLRYKHFIIALYLAAGGVFVVFNLMLLNVIPQSLGGLGAAISLGSVLMGAGNVLFYELAVEIAYPAPEGLIGCIVTVLNNGFGALMYPLQGNLTSNVIMWINAGNSIVFGLVMFFLRENYNRHSKDVMGELSEDASSAESKNLMQAIQ